MYLSADNLGQLLEYRCFYSHFRNIFENFLQDVCLLTIVLSIISGVVPPSNLRCRYHQMSSLLGVARMVSTLPERHFSNSSPTCGLPVTSIRVPGDLCLKSPAITRWYSEFPLYLPILLIYRYQFYLSLIIKRRRNQYTGLYTKSKGVTGIGS